MPSLRHQAHGLVLPSATPSFLVILVVAALFLVASPGNLAAATPRPLARPWPAPTTVRTVAVPSSVDATGTRDASPALHAFLRTVPDRSVVTFKAGGIYRLDRGIFLSNRHHLVLDGKGATLRAGGPSTLIAASPILIDGANSNIVIRNFTIEGNNPRVDADQYDPSQENQQGIAIYGGSRIEIAGNLIRYTHGDGIYASLKDTTGTWADRIWIHDNRLARIGRSGITFNAVSNGLVERNRLNQIGMFVFNVEPDTSAQGARKITYRNNTILSYGLTPRFTSWFFASANYNVAPGAVVDGITITGNRVTTGAPSTTNTPHAGGLATWIGRPRVKNVVFANNTTTKAGRGPVLVFEHVDGLTVTGNQQPLSGGSLMRISDSTGVRTSNGEEAAMVVLLVIVGVALGAGRLAAARGQRPPPPPRRPAGAGRSRSELNLIRRLDPGAHAF